MRLIELAHSRLMKMAICRRKYPSALDQGIECFFLTSDPDKPLEPVLNSQLIFYYKLMAID
jgi:hypothetical protein